MKNKFLLGLAYLLLAMAPVATSYANTGTPVNKIIFFGDSLSDNGNLFARDFGFLPKSPPYFDGRFTNGTVWTEKVSAWVGSTWHLPQAANIYATGGSTAGLHVGKYLPYTLSAQYNNYWLRTNTAEGEHTLFIIWIGANDYLPMAGNDDADATSTTVVDDIQYVINQLIKYNNAKNFLIVNLPDVSLTPRVLTSEIAVQKKLHEAVMLHNTKLATAVLLTQKKNPDITIQLFNAYDILNTLFYTPDIINQQYGSHITNTATACWQGGMTLKGKINNEMNQEDLIREQFINYLQQHEKALGANSRAMMNDSQLDVFSFVKAIAQNPDLSAAYDVSKQAEEGFQPCTDPNNRLYWDSIHPSAAVHEIITKAMTNFIEQHYQHQ